MSSMMVLTSDLESWFEQFEVSTESTDEGGEKAGQTKGLKRHIDLFWKQ